jgi:protein TonB
VLFSTHIVLSSAAAIVLGSYYIVDASPSTWAAIRPSSAVRAIDRPLAQQAAPPPVVPVPQSPPPPGSANSGSAATAQKKPACGPNPIPVGPNATNQPYVYRGPHKRSTPSRIAYVPPEYPQNARSAKVQGIVVLETEIDRDGRVCSARVLRSIPLLDHSAIDAVLRWRFTPAKVNDVAVPVVMTLTVNFTLPQ